MIILCCSSLIYELLDCKVLMSLLSATNSDRSDFLLSLEVLEASLSLLMTVVEYDIPVCEEGDDLGWLNGSGGGTSDDMV